MIYNEWYTHRYIKILFTVYDMKIKKNDVNDKNLDTNDK